MTRNIGKTLGIGIVLIQLLDIILHAATDQLEIIRVASNLVILLWLAAAMTGWLQTKFTQLAVGSIGLYAILNLVFVAREGLTNPEQGGGLRITLFLLVLLTTVFSILYSFLQHKRLTE